ncbi:DUF2283 domain-containing protein [Nocardioides sp.]|uniref:DUF2283 domain-containing protein n=1 Tax=Nocardioides sp. TaxID=35761 RepID=UPI002638AC67|nr:DUF2283 domain-containing protein [Nocardioides sp.]MCW2738858.1 hypothetical protein [Nocardioides sp.]
MSSIGVEIDHDADAAYIRLSAEPVVRSVAVGEEVVVDLDAMSVVVGIEMLSLDADIPYSVLVKDYHVRSEVTALLRRLRPSISGYLSLQSMGEGSMTASNAAVPAG